MKNINAMTEQVNPEPNKFDEFWKKYKPLAMFLVGVLNAFPISAPFTNSIKKALGALDGGAKENAAAWFGFVVTLGGMAYYIYLTLKGDPQASDIIDIVNQLPSDTI